MPEQRIGVMQGRLSPRPEHRLQAFPHQTWPDEFAQAKRIGFSYLEWIYEAERAEQNPIASRAGRAAICACSAETALPVASVCADYFMIRRLAGGSREQRELHARQLGELVCWTREIGATRILLPLLETSALETAEQVRELTESIHSVCRELERFDVVLGLELEIPGPEYAALIRGIGHDLVRAYYDTGNSTAQGFDIAQDIVPLLPLLEAVHLKDRERFGSSRRFGSGSANFDGLFATLNQYGFRGDLLTQHYFDADPEGAAAHSLRFVRENLWRKQAA